MRTVPSRPSTLAHDDEDGDDDDEQVNTTSCKPDDFLPLARERYHPHKALNPVKCQIQNTKVIYRYQLSNKNTKYH